MLGLGLSLNAPLLSLVNKMGKTSREWGRKQEEEGNERQLEDLTGLPEPWQPYSELFSLWTPCTFQEASAT